MNSDSCQTRKGGDPINEEKLLRSLQRKKPKALEAVIVQYTPLVSTIVSNIIGPYMTAMDIEDVTSDVFFALWNHAGDIAPGKLKAYLSSIARNKAKNKLREYRPLLSVEEDCLDLPDDGFEKGILRRETSAMLRSAVQSLGHPDSEIFVRYYYYYQTTSQIAAAMQLNPSTVQTRLHRGRKKLKQILLEGGYSYESEPL